MAAPHAKLPQRHGAYGEDQRGNPPAAMVEASSRLHPEPLKLFFLGKDLGSRESSEDPAQPSPAPDVIGEEERKLDESSQQRFDVRDPCLHRMKTEMTVTAEIRKQNLSIGP
jgi:hypothetical protein